MSKVFMTPARSLQSVASDGQSKMVFSAKHSPNGCRVAVAVYFDLTGDMVCLPTSHIDRKNFSAAIRAELDTLPAKVLVQTTTHRPDRVCRKLLMKWYAIPAPTLTMRIP